jgi:hypothetical protein
MNCEPVSRSAISSPLVYHLDLNARCPQYRVFQSFAFAIDVPQGQIGLVYQAVQASIFYRRHGEQCLPMAEYEIRERYSRTSFPDITLRLSIPHDTDPIPKWSADEAYLGPLRVAFVASNRGFAAAKHMLFRIWFDDRLHVVHGLRVPKGGTKIVVDGNQRLTKMIQADWNIPTVTPLFGGTARRVFDSVIMCLPTNPYGGTYTIWWSVEAEGMVQQNGSANLGIDSTATLTIEEGGPIQDRILMVDEEL